MANLKLAAISAVLAIAVLAVPPAAGAGLGETLDAVAKRQHATSSDGWFLGGRVSGIEDSRPGDFSLEFNFAYPGETVQANGPQHADEADLREPWVSVVEMQHDIPGAGHSEGPYRGSPDYYVVCAGFANPTSYRGMEPQADGAPRVFADVSCDDDRGYDFYRVEWDYRHLGYNWSSYVERCAGFHVGEENTGFGYVWGLEPSEEDEVTVGEGTCRRAPSRPTYLYNEATSPYGWGPNNDISTKANYRGGFGGVTWSDPRPAGERPMVAVDLKVCGHRGGEVDCFTSPRRGIWA